MVCSKINVLNLQKFVPRELLSFVKTERFLPLLVRALSSINPQGSLLVAENWGGINQLQTKLPLISLFSYNSHT